MAAAPNTMLTVVRPPPHLPFDNLSESNMEFGFGREVRPYPLFQSSFPLVSLVSTVSLVSPRLPRLHPSP